jgi:hypothetical protein
MTGIQAGTFFKEDSMERILVVITDGRHYIKAKTDGVHCDIVNVDDLLNHGFTMDEIDAEIDGVTEAIDSMNKEGGMS